MTKIDNACPSRPVPVGAVLPFAAVAALDELARKSGVTRSAMLRSIIDRGLKEAMASDPDLAARYASLPHATPRMRRRARTFSLDTHEAAREVV